MIEGHHSIVTLSGISSKKLSRYLNWIGMHTRVFNLGDYRRRVEGCAAPSHEFFNTNNKQGMAIRQQVCEEGLADMFSWIEAGKGEVAVFDATNTTRERRCWTVLTKVSVTAFFQAVSSPAHRHRARLQTVLRGEHLRRPEYRAVQH